MLGDFDATLDAVYSAGADPARWHRALAQVTTLVSGLGAALHVGDTDCSGFSFGASHALDPSALSEYAEHYFAVNPLNHALNRVAAGSVVGHHELMPRPAYLKSEFFNDYSRRYGMEGSATAVLARADGQLACVGVVRALGAEPYSREDLALLKRLLPHLQRAVFLNKQLAAVTAERDQMKAALDRLELAVIFVGENGRVVSANIAGERLLRAGDGLALRRSRLAASMAIDTPGFARLLEVATKARGAAGGDIALGRPSRKRPLTLRVVPHRARDDTPSERDVRAIVFVKDPEQAGASGFAAAASSFGLTSAETKLVFQLVDGVTLKEAAEAQEIAVVTARNHLASAMRKTDTSRQSDLVRVLLSSRLPLRDS